MPNFADWRTPADIAEGIIPLIPPLVDTVFGEGTTDEFVKDFEIPLPKIKVFGLPLGVVAIGGFALLIGIIIYTRK